jgi:serine/threonine-protein kinase
MSPEQAMGQRDIDLRSDLWAVAVVAYQCLTGELPFVGDTVLDIAMNIISGPIPSPPVEAGLPPSFEAWWLRAVARDRTARFASANEQIEALAAAFALPRRSLLPHGHFSGRPVEPPPAAPFMLATTRPPEASFPDSGLARPGSSDGVRTPTPSGKMVGAFAAIGAIGILVMLWLAMRSPRVVAAPTSASADEGAAMAVAAPAPSALPAPAPADEPSAAASVAAAPSAPPSATATPARRIRKAAAPPPPPPPPSRYHWTPRPASPR